MKLNMYINYSMDGFSVFPYKNVFYGHHESDDHVQS